ncbi:MAG: hypothetical protein H7Z75_10135 [Ferruginibacter sp.]|nr:hypothetical protein [Cytophagales bacterium]
METKLTLKLSKGVIEKAKSYAKTQNTSLSKLIERYLDKVVSEEKDDQAISPPVRSLSGIADLPDDYDYKADYTDSLDRKYR